MNSRKIPIYKSIVCEKLATIPLSAAERREALYAVESGERIASALLEIGHFLRLLVATPHLKPGFKH